MGSYLVCIEGKNKGGVGEGFTGSQVLGGRMLDAR